MLLVEIIFGYQDFILRHRPALGQCLSAFASCFPIAFLEAEFNKYNKYSVLAKTQDQSVQVQGLKAFF